MAAGKSPGGYRSWKSCWSYQFCRFMGIGFGYGAGARKPRARATGATGGNGGDGGDGRSRSCGRRSWGASSGRSPGSPRWLVVARLLPRAKQRTFGRLRGRGCRGGGFLGTSKLFTYRWDWCKLLGVPLQLLVLTVQMLGSSGCWNYQGNRSQNGSVSSCRGMYFSCLGSRQSKDSCPGVNVVFDLPETSPSVGLLLSSAMFPRFGQLEPSAHKVPRSQRCPRGGE